jgi:hypothetical protein
MRKLCLKLNNVEILHRRMGNLQGWMRYCFLVNRSLLLLLLLLSPCLIIIARFIQCTSVAVVVDRRERGSEGRRDGDGGGETEERERERERESGDGDEETEERHRRHRGDVQRNRDREEKEGFEWILGAMPCLFVSIFGGFFSVRSKFSLAVDL